MRASGSILLLVLASSLVCAAAAADDDAIPDSKRAKIQEIMRLQGLLETFQQMRASGRARSTALVEDQFTKMLAANPEMPTNLVLESRLAMRTALEEIDASWTVEEALDVYALHYGRALSEEELDQIIAYWSSPIGRRELEASRAAMGPFVEFIQKRSESEFADAMTRYQEKLAIVMERLRSGAQ